MFGQSRGRSARRVKFNKVHVLEFNRVLGRQSVPEQGTFALGLGDVLVDTREVSVREFEGGVLEREAKDIDSLSERQRMVLLDMNAQDPNAMSELRELAVCACRVPTHTMLLLSDMLSGDPAVALHRLCVQR